MRILSLGNPRFTLIHLTDYDSSGSESSTQHGKMKMIRDSNNISDLHELYFVLYNTRYLVQRNVTPKSDEFATQFFHTLPDKLFRQMTRMDKSTFFHLLSLIENNPVFHNNSN